MSPARIAIGIICAMAVAAGRRAYALAAAVVLSLALMACAATPPAVPDEPPVSALGMYEAGKADGRKEALEELRADPAFSVTEYELSECRDEVSSLPKSGPIEPIIWWRSRSRNLWLLNECRSRNAAKIPVIYRMLHRIREPQ